MDYHTTKHLKCDVMTSSFSPKKQLQSLIKEQKKPWEECLIIHDSQHTSESTIFKKLEEHSLTSQHELLIHTCIFICTRTRRSDWKIYKWEIPETMCVSIMTPDSTAIVNHSSNRKRYLWLQLLFHLKIVDWVVPLQLQITNPTPSRERSPYIRK